MAPVLLLAGLGTTAQEAAEEQPPEGGIEVVIVTAQRVDESVQEVPIAVTALSAEMLEDRQVINPTDLQLNIPNVSYTATNFGGSSFSIRGVGNLVIGRTGESGVSTHVNEVALPLALNVVEFLDLERAEVLRGPQGTLFGRNATGGAINVVTNMPQMGTVGGFLEAQYGDYNHQRTTGVFNLPLGERVAFRAAAVSLQRDGYIDNVAYDQRDAQGRRLPGIDEDVDGRDLFSARTSLAWEITDDVRAWVQYSLFDEDDDRARITNQVCVRNNLPTTGCAPDEFGFESPHLGATTAGIFAGAVGALPPGADGSDASLYDFPRPALGFREMHTDFEPVAEVKSEIVSFGVEAEFGPMFGSLIGARLDRQTLLRQDYLMDVGAVLGPFMLNPAGAYPISEPAGGAGAEWTSADCNLAAGTSGLFGGCALGIQQNRVFAYDQLDADINFWTLEAKLHSAFDAPFNFLIGASARESENVGGYYVLANTLDLVSLYGSPALGAPPLYPGFFYNSNDPETGGAQQDGTALFGELYFDFSDRLTLTAGVRYNEDNNEVADSSALFNSADVNAALGGLLGPDPIWLRLGLFGEMVAMASNPALALSGGSAATLAFHNAGTIYADNAPAAIATVAAIGAAQQIGQLVATGVLPPEGVPQAVGGLGLPPLFQASVLALLSQSPAAIGADPGIGAGAAAFNAIAQALGPVPAFNEARIVTGSPTEASWNELSGRLGLDFQLDANTLLYGFFNRGFKPGGFNAAIPVQFQSTTPFTFDTETVDAFEFGAKTTMLDGRLLANAAVFTYDYTGLQVTRIRNNTSVNENVDASVSGFEVEGLWRPEALPGMSVDFSYGFLSTSVDDTQSLDPVNRTGGDPAYILLNNIDPGAVTGVNYVARESQISAALVTQALTSGAALDIRNGTTVTSVSYPANGAGVSIPAYFSRNFLNAAGVETLEGVPVDLDGNTLPNSPEHTIKVGVAHSWNVLRGTLTGRWDVYWQSDSYAREFNTRGDEIDSWLQHNAALIYEADRWTARAWVRNVLDEDNVTGKYLTSDTSGFFRNYFLTEPRIFGVSLRYAFGG